MTHSRPVALAIFLSVLAAPVSAAPPLRPLPPDPEEKTGLAPAENELTGPSQDGRRTAGRFVKNLGRNAVGFFSSDNLLPAALTLSATGTAALFDDDVQAFFTEKRRAKRLGDFVSIEGQPVVVAPLAVLLFGAGRLTSHEHQGFRDATYDIAQAAVLETVFISSIKYASQRLRPDASNSLSFPSGHACNAFAWATIAARHFGAKVAIPSYLFATAVAIGRMERNNHYLSDVVGGAGLGYLIGRSVTTRDKEPLPGEKRFSIEPLIPPGGGLGVRASLDF